MEALERFVSVTHSREWTSGSAIKAAISNEYAEACLWKARRGDWLGAICEAVHAADEDEAWKDLPGVVYKAHAAAHAALQAPIGGSDGISVPRM